MSELLPEEAIWANEPGIQLWINTENICVKLKILKVPENKILAVATLAPHRAERLGQLMPKVVKSESTLTEYKGLLESILLQTTREMRDSVDDGFLLDLIRDSCQEALSRLKEKIG